MTWNKDFEATHRRFKAREPNDNAGRGALQEALHLAALEAVADAAQGWRSAKGYSDYKRAEAKMFAALDALDGKEVE